MSEKRFHTIKIKPAGFLFHISQIYLYLIAAELLLSSVLFFCGKSLNWYFLPVCYALAVFALCCFYDEEVCEQMVLEIVVSILLLVLFSYLSGRICDPSWDGNWYHKETVGLLRYHWNPLKQIPEGSFAMRVLGSDLNGNTLWTETYPKAAEMVGASIYLLTGNIETGKAYTLLAMFCAFGITCYFLRKHGKTVLCSLIFSIAAAMNPIAVQQMDTFYVDGFLHILLYLVVISLTMHVESNPVISGRVSFSLIASSVMVCSNIKFTGLAFSGIYCVGYYMFWCVMNWRKKREQWLHLCISKGLKFILLAFVSVFWAGSSAYLTNAIRHHNLFYPLMGSDKGSFLETMNPYPGLHAMVTFFISLFSKHGKKDYPDLRSQLKVPFCIYPEEMEKMNGYDTMFAGYGVWFSGLFLVALIVILISLYRMKKDGMFCFWMMNLSLIALLCFAVKQSWYARYSPYVYFLVLIGLYFVLDYPRARIRNCVGGILFAAFLVNSCLFFKDIPYELQASNEIYRNLDSMRQYECVYFDSFKLPEKGFLGFIGLYFNLIDRRVNYQIKPDLYESGNYYRLHANYPCFLSGVWLPKY